MDYQALLDQPLYSLAHCGASQPGEPREVGAGYTIPMADEIQQDFGAATGADIDRHRSKVAYLWHGSERFSDILGRCY